MAQGTLKFFFLTDSDTQNFALDYYLKIREPRRQQTPKL